MYQKIVSVIFPLPQGYTDLSIFTSNGGEGGNNLFKERLERQEVGVYECVQHFRDWQRSKLNEVARAFLDKGDYKVLEKFKRESDTEYAERILDKVSGPTWRMREEEKRGNNFDPEEPVGRGRPKAVVNLTKSFDDLDAALDDIYKEVENTADATSSEAGSPIQLRKKQKVSYEEPVDLEDIQDRLDLIFEEDDSEEFNPTLEEMDDEEEYDHGVIHQSEIEDIVAIGSRILSLDNDRYESDTATDGTVTENGITREADVNHEEEEQEPNGANVRSIEAEITSEDEGHPILIEANPENEVIEEPGNAKDQDKTTPKDVENTDQVEIEIIDKNDQYPTMQKHGQLFKLAGKGNTMFVDPLGNTCSLCGHKKSKNSWCRHLVSAGLKMSPPILVSPLKDGTNSLDKLICYQKTSKKKTGRKAPKTNDYKDDSLATLPERGPYRYSTRFTKEKHQENVQKENVQKEIYIDNIEDNPIQKDHSKSQSQAESTGLQCKVCAHKVRDNFNLKRHMRKHD